MSQRCITTRELYYYTSQKHTALQLHAYNDELRQLDTIKSDINTIVNHNNLYIFYILIYYFIFY